MLKTPRDHIRQVARHIFKSKSNLVVSSPIDPAFEDQEIPVRIKIKIMKGMAIDHNFGEVVIDTLAYFRGGYASGKFPVGHRKLAPV
jgi:hypothetical protein